jgi:hypothetical protein
MSGYSGENNSNWCRYKASHTRCHCSILRCISVHNFSKPGPISDLTDSITPAPLPHNESLALRAVWVKTK